MIPDSRGNRIVTRGFIGMVSAMPLISITLTIFAILLPFTGPLSLPKCTIFAWCLCESSLWVWLRVQTLQRQESWTRVIPSGEERKKLKEDWVHIIHSQDEEGAIEFVEGWFKTGNRRTQLREIHLENVKDWLCSAFFAGTREQIGADSALLAEMQEALTDLCNALQQRLPEWKIPEGRNPNVDSVRLTLDPIKCEHRPLIFYFVVYLLQSSASTLFRLRGYSYRKLSHPSEPALDYWYRPPTAPASTRPPIVVIHGVGSILPLFRLVMRLRDRAQHRHVFVLDLGHVSMRLPRPSRFPSPEGSCFQIRAMIDRHVLPSDSGVCPKATLFTHSLGSAYAVWMLKVAPERLAGLVLCDPISILLQHPTVAYNFIYRKSLAATEMFFEWIAREPGIAVTLGRHFHWFQNIFPFIAEVDSTASAGFFPQGLPATIFLSERDCIVPSARIVEVLRRGKKDNVDVYMMPKLDHGGFVFHKTWLDKVVHTLVELDIE